MSAAAYPAHEVYPARLEAQPEQPLPRWLMTDRYPPFRLDMGEREPAGP